MIKYLNEQEMKKIVLTIATLMITGIGFSQFKYKTVDNDFDPAYRIVYNQNSEGTLMKMENIDGIVCLYLQNGLFCGKELNVDIVFIMPNGTKSNYNINCAVSDDSELLMLSEDFINSIMVNDFKKASTMKIRVNDSYCENSYYQFNMSGSTNALNFID